MYKYILVPATGSRSDASVFDTALLAAKLFDAHLEFLHVRADVRELVISMTARGMAGAPPQGLVDQLEAEGTQLEVQARRIVEDFCSRCLVPLMKTPSRKRVSAEFTVEIGSWEKLIPAYGSFADVVVIGRPQPERNVSVLEVALMNTGRPLLVAPPTPPKTLLGTVVIAWKNTFEAVHAVVSALPLLERAEQVEILTIVEEDDPREPNLDRVLHSLCCHNPNTHVHQIANEQHKPVDMLLQQAERMQASLIVMGGYSHSRLREVLFGGFTQRILSGVGIPVLMAH
jgi:nucleotide-binding universal stress UspA family protein